MSKIENFFQKNTKVTNARAIENNTLRRIAATAVVAGISAVIVVSAVSLSKDIDKIADQFKNS